MLAGIVWSGVDNVAVRDSASGAAGFYDDLASDYHRIYPDWAGSVRRQGAALQALLGRELGPGSRAVLDCAVGIGTQLLGLAAYGHRLAGTDISRGAVRRARAECALRAVPAALAVADMRALPFPAASFDAVVCADNSLPHLLRAGEVAAALREMRRVTIPGGVVVVTTRDYDAARAGHPRITPPSLAEGPDGPTITLQLWDWHADREHYDLRHLQLSEQAGGGWQVVERRTTYWALTRAELAGHAGTAGLTAPTWHSPDQTGFFQPLMLTRVPATH